MVDFSVLMFQIHVHNYHVTASGDYWPAFQVPSLTVETVAHPGEPVACATAEQPGPLRHRMLPPGSLRDSSGFSAREQDRLEATWGVVGVEAHRTGFSVCPAFAIRVR